MERTLVMIRHAKSSWANPLQSDFERPLNERGERDAPMMGARLKEQGILPDLIISSTAKRAKSTAKKIAAALDYDHSRIQMQDNLYHCIPSVFEEAIYAVDDKIKTLFIVAHNPGITDFVNQLSGSFKIDNMPTCGVVVAKMNMEEWNQFANATKQVFLFDYPKRQI
ncbi:MAG: histidine phosphatase family protein [Sphingobacteriales bacterium]|nr:MAG: histidine phosphatase family protein [Sphingobacteriales bacterium]